MPPKKKHEISGCNADAFERCGAPSNFVDGFLCGMEHTMRCRTDLLIERTRLAVGRHRKKIDAMPVPRAIEALDEIVRQENAKLAAEAARLQT